MRSTRVRDRRRAFVLIAVLVVVAMLSYSAYTYTYWLSIEAEMSSVEGGQVQARYLAESGVALVETLAIQKLLGREVPAPGNCAELFEAISVPFSIEEKGGAVGEERSSGRFTVHSTPPSADRLATLNPDQAAMRFGVESEAARIHLNHWRQADPESLEQALSALPGATTPLVHAVLDWLDGDDDKRPQGAEFEDYADIDPAISPRNGPIESIEELLLVKGMTPEILYGEDTNRNGRLDPNEDDGEASPPEDDANGELKAGWIGYLTLWSQEPNVDSRGRRRINLNSEDLGALYSSLAEEFGVETARFVIARRLFGPATKFPGSQWQDEAPWPGRFLVGSAIDLIDGQVQGVWDGQAVSLRSPLQSTKADFGTILTTMLDRLTTRWDERFVGQLDLSTASPEAMKLIPLILDPLRERIVENRPVVGAVQELKERDTAGDSLGDTATLAWLFRPDLLRLRELRDIEPLATSTSAVVRFQSLGYSDWNRTTYRLEVVMDRSTRPCRILQWRRMEGSGSAESLGASGGEVERKDLPKVEATATREPDGLGPGNPRDRTGGFVRP